LSPTQDKNDPERDRGTLRSYPGPVFEILIVRKQCQLHLKQARGRPGEKTVYVRSFDDYVRDSASLIKKMSCKFENGQGSSGERTMSEKRRYAKENGCEKHTGKKLTIMLAK